ncbi:MAG: acyl-CoA dehydratase activase [Desulfobacterales bacterium]|nr:acyl-CoA dehydratase activase [Desulfobacterales bacterium]
MPDKIKSLGICLGASTVSLVQMERKSGHGALPFERGPSSPRVVHYSLHTHDGNPKQTLLNALEKLDMDSFDRIAVTGRRFRQFLKLTSISEPESVEYAYQFVAPSEVSSPAVVSAGGETFMVYVLNRSGQISNVLTGNKCASGTGEFFLQQLRRMNVSLNEAAHWAVEEAPHEVSGRCSVFCKSDCTHATNKGIPKAKVTAGLCKMMANKILELLKTIKRENIMIVGGTAQNQMMISYLQKEIPGLIVPEEAPYFEALGAALWAFENETTPYPGAAELFRTDISSFDTLPPLHTFQDMVEFKTMESGRIQAGDECILGLDVGSTTTKAVLLRKGDNALLASVYTRTNGDPVGASRQCYQSIYDQVAETVTPDKISIIGLGVCGSGRQIAGLHALTNGVVNEIIAHATAAIYFDPDVDTLFEIGGQDAKYTYITNGVPSDYAMNEACSAGTGSFLEESAQETLGVRMEDIADIALQCENPPNFNDQCAAFISSDIKNAIHEGVRREDLVAGLVYSICMNYSNRVKGNRPVGRKVFMQGGVCYNKAIPLAMASLIGTAIIVPPEPGLMGAFGVALEVEKRLASGLMARENYDLSTLANREVRYGKSFTCGGGKEKCDRRCNIAVIQIEGHKYPFGGACNRYYNLRHKISHPVEKLDLVHFRQRLIFGTSEAKPIPGNKKKRGRVGINRSFLTHALYPLYATFFIEMGFEIALPNHFSQTGIDQKNSAYCYPGDLSHGYFYSLLQMDPPPEYIFLPHVKSIPASDGHPFSEVCPFVQGEPYFLQSTFRQQLNRLSEQGTQVLSPLLDMNKGFPEARKALLETASQMKINRFEAEKAFNAAVAAQDKFIAEIKASGEKALAELEADPEKIAVVIFGRPYNGFAEEAHMGIPHKFASRGVLVLPLDFLSFDTRQVKRHMYWGMGQLILKAAEIVKRHPQLFGTFITNFSCGPDSFVLGYFREIMGRKPSLTLELDSHTADAGIETRIEAFLDIIAAYRQLLKRKEIVKTATVFSPARLESNNGATRFITSAGKIFPMKDPRVTLLFPSMGKIATEAIAAVFAGAGFNAKAHPPADELILKLGRANTSCKECLPLILTTGTMLSYIRNEKKDNELLIYFMPTGSGPCRFGQYYIFMEDLVRRLKIPDVALLSLTADNAYAGFGNSFHRKAWWAIVISDVMEDIRSMLLANARDAGAALLIFHEEWRKILSTLEQGEFSIIEEQLLQTCRHFKNIALKRPAKEVPLIGLVGEIFVRRDSISRQYLTEHLAGKGFAVICAPIAEWMYYTDYAVEKAVSGFRIPQSNRFELLLRKNFMAKYENRIKAIFATTGLVRPEPVHIKSIINHAKPYISANHEGEAVLTVGSALEEIVTHVCGIISIGPFGCMPNRLAETLLTEAMTGRGKLAAGSGNKQFKALLSEMDDLPFLTIESDGSPFPQLINAKLETLCLRAGRLHVKMLQFNENKRPDSIFSGRLRSRFNL